jgi:hypothetical protein
MKYALLSYIEDGTLERLPQPEQDQILREFIQFRTGLKENGQWVDSQRLHPTNLATSVRSRNGETLVTDGPFADTKEQFGGYFIVDVPSIDEAIEIAARMPTARFGTVEVRPVMDVPAQVPV